MTKLFKIISTGEEFQTIKITENILKPKTQSRLHCKWHIPVKLSWLTQRMRGKQLEWCSHPITVADRSLGLGVRITPGARKSVSWVFCVFRWRSASGWSLVQRSRTECDREASTVMSPCPTKGCLAMAIMYSVKSNKRNWNYSHHTEVDGYATRQQQRKAREHNTEILHLRPQDQQLTDSRSPKTQFSTDRFNEHGK